MQIQAEQGYLVLAVNRGSRDYVGMAQRLRQSLCAWHPGAMTCLLTDQDPGVTGFDFTKILPRGDLGGYANDWQVYPASPFRETIKLEADMLICSEIDHWWTLLRHRDVVISTGARDWQHRDITSRHYRRVFDANDLPDVYNAVTYWRRSQTAHDFWTLVRAIFENWTSYRSLLKFAPDKPDTDLVYALAAEILGREMVTMPFASYPRITHMRSRAIGTTSTRWCDELIWELSGRHLRVGTVSQWGCFHYHDKDWCP